MQMKINMLFLVWPGHMALVASVSWGDRFEKGGFSIAATKRKLSSSLIIGPGSGYNLASNPLAEDFTGTKGRTNNETKKRFSEQLRDEGESFKVVFDKRKQHIGVFENGDVTNL